MSVIIISQIYYYYDLLFMSHMVQIFLTLLLSKISQSLKTDDTRPATAIPPVMASIGQRIAADLNVHEFDQLTVNAYNPGEV